MSSRCAYSEPLPRPASLHLCQNTCASPLCHAPAQLGVEWALWLPRRPFGAYLSPLERPRLARAPPLPSAPRTPLGRLTAASFRFLLLRWVLLDEIEGRLVPHGDDLAARRELVLLAMLEFAHDQGRYRCLRIELRTPVCGARAAAAAVARSRSRRAAMHRTLNTHNY